MGQNNRFFITTGDTDGIGPEITLKSLRRIKNHRGHFVWCNSDLSKKIQAKFKCLVLKVNSASDLKKLLPLTRASKNLVVLESRLSPSRWVEVSAQFCSKKLFQGVVTAPLSKTEIRKSGMKDIGHTQILSRVSGCKNLHMFFLGDSFNVLIATGHIPLSQVPKRMSSTTIKNAVLAAHHARKLLPKHLRSKPIRVLGLNPHAGEKGIIGTEEKKLISPLLLRLKKSGIKVSGPEVPDAAFDKAKDTSVFVSLYHDQGLIPFKLIHGRDAVHVTLGLPFLRTSVDHGTAKDIFGKNRADESSMLRALVMMRDHLGMKG